MGEIYSVYEVMPNGDETDLNAIANNLANIVPAGVKVNKTEVVPHVFGLMKIHVELIINADDETIGSKLEDALTGIEGVGDVECISSTNI
ncbi:MAG: translation elongation factor EF-1beta [archaeon]|nr:translation elongation factor EF-1beta [archaeon]